MDLQKFNLDDIRDFSNITIVGGQKTGKTTIIKDIFQHKHLTNVICICDNEHSSQFMKMYLTSQRYKPLCIVSFQEFVIDRTMRANADYVFITQINELDVHKRIWEDFCNNPVYFTVFDKLLTDYTQDYKCIVIDYNDTYNMYWYQSIVLNK